MCSARSSCSPGKAAGLTCSGRRGAAASTPLLFTLTPSSHSSLSALGSGVDEFRLVGGASRCAGSLELKVLGEQRPVRNGGFTLKTAALIYSVRLMNGSSRCSGRLQVKTNPSDQAWSSVCEADLDLQDAQVVCRELGCGAPSVLQEVLYGDMQTPRWSPEFQCGGHESALLDCRSSGSARSSCSPGKAAGLTCSGRRGLVGGASRCAGSLELKVLGEQRPLGDGDFTMKTAALICEHLHCGSVVSVQPTAVSVQSMWRIDSDCVQSGSDLWSCVKSWNNISSNLTCSARLSSLLCVVMSLQASRGQTGRPGGR
uniref:SRCR domain-containing protein n=1 Tax=Salarias fasciatus TaxID=181472 RepID=A0A672G989_SALFA